MTNIRPVLASVDRALDLDVKRMQTVGHLRRTARDIAANLFNVHDETAEVVALQNSLEGALRAFCEAMRSPAAAISYVSPDAVRALITAQSEAAKYDSNQEEPS